MRRTELMRHLHRHGVVVIGEGRRHTEMVREGIAVGQVLIEHAGRLADYANGGHPYG